jgi:hypothetical protein
MDKHVNAIKTVKEYQWLNQQEDEYNELNKFVDNENHMNNYKKNFIMTDSVRSAPKYNPVSPNKIKRSANSESLIELTKLQALSKQLDMLNTDESSTKSTQSVISINPNKNNIINSVSNKEKKTKTVSKKPSKIIKKNVPIKYNMIDIDSIANSSNDDVEDIDIHSISIGSVEEKKKTTKKKKN